MHLFKCIAAETQVALGVVVFLFWFFSSSVFFFFVSASAVSRNREKELIDLL